LPPIAAGGLVFFTSAAVLVLEILAGRLLAPYVGVTLETYTAIIGTVLAGIAGGTWAGGYVADRVEPRSLLGPLLVGGGALALATVPLTRALGGQLSGQGRGSVVLLSVLTFFAPAAVLSAVNPSVVKLQLRDLSVTGSVVGRLSALGTAGAIIGTFVAGFALVDLFPTTTSILGIGGLLVVAGTVLWVRFSRTTTGSGVASVLLLALAGVGAGIAAGDPCDVETKYHCARVEEDATRPGGRLLVLDTLNHSYVDVDDPTHLEFRYTKVFGDVIAALAPEGPLDAVHVGGGGFTLPRYLRATRPGSTNVVLEIDGGVLDLARDRLGLRTGSGLDVRVGDARLLLDDLPRHRHHVVLGDAFGGTAVPWHLTTVEFVEAVRGSLLPGGFYVINLIDQPPVRFGRAQAATLRRAFAHAALVAPPAYVEGRSGGNFVLVGSDRAIDADALRARIAARGGEEQVVVDDALATFVGGAPVLTDDHAPVDQWLARARGS
jgi:spermidine synthase